MRQKRKIWAQRRLDDDRRLMLNPADWPRWPVLPLKRRDGNLDRPDGLGFLLNYDFSLVKPTVYFGNIDRIACIVDGIKEATHAERVRWSEVTDTMEQLALDDIEDVLAVYTVD